MPNNELRVEHSRDRRAPWERPALRRLEANKAEGGLNPCNDGTEGAPGCGPVIQNHS